MKKKYLIVFLTYLFFISLALRTVFLTPGTLGHNWDWSIPASALFIDQIGESLFYTWRNFSLGEPISLWLPSFPVFSLIVILAKFNLTPEIISKLIVFVTFFLSCGGMFILVESLKLTKKRSLLLTPFLVGLFYGFSPFLFAELIGGAITQFIAYGLLPWIFVFWNRYFLFKKKRDFLLSLIVLSLISMSLQALILTALILMTQIIIALSRRDYLNHVIFLFTGYLFLNSYWLLPMLRETQSVLETIPTGSTFSTFTVRELVPDFFQAFINIGYTRPFYQNIIPDFVFRYWQFFIISFWILLISKTTISRNIKGIFWLLLFLISLIFSTAGKEPLGNYILWLYDKLFIMSLFRSPQHFILATVFCFSMVFAYSIKANKKFTLVFILALLVYLLPFLLNGDLGTASLREKKMEYIDHYQLSPGYSEVFEKIVSDSDDYRILYLPLSGSPKYLKTEYQNENQGGDPLVVYSLKDTVVTDISYGTKGLSIARDFEKILCDNLDQKTNPIINLLGVKYLILRNDVIPHFSDCQNWDIRLVTQKLLKDGYRIIYQKDYITLFQNNYFAPHLSVYGKEKLPGFNYQKINPTEYLIEVNNATAPFYLIFNESFNPGWKLFTADNKHFWNFLLKPSAFENSHQAVNVYMNQWEIDQNGNYYLRLIYRPQAYFNLGKTISLLFLFLLISLFAYNDRIKYNSKD